MFYGVQDVPFGPEISVFTIVWQNVSPFWGWGVGNGRIVQFVHGLQPSHVTCHVSGGLRPVQITAPTILISWDICTVLFLYSTFAFFTLLASLAHLPRMSHTSASHGLHIGYTQNVKFINIYTIIASRVCVFQTLGKISKVRICSIFIWEKNVCHFE